MKIFQFLVPAATAVLVSGFSVVSGQTISSCTYNLPSFSCNIQFPCGAKVDSSKKEVVDISKNIRNSKGDLVVLLEWHIYHSKSWEKQIFGGLVKAETEFRKKQIMKDDWKNSREAAFGIKNEPNSLLLACGDTVYCAEYQNYYTDPKMGRYSSFTFINISTHAIAVFRGTLKLNQGYNMNDIKAFHSKLNWYPRARVVAPVNQISLQAPAGIFDVIEDKGKIYLFKWNIRDSAFMATSSHSEADVLPLKEFIQITKSSLNTLTAVKTIEKQITAEQKKMGWTSFPPEKIQLQGSSASEVSKIRSFRVNSDGNDGWSEDSCAYYILSFQDSKVKKDVPPNIRTIIIVYVPLKGPGWIRSVSPEIRHRFLASIKPEYSE